MELRLCDRDLIGQHSIQILYGLGNQGSFYIFVLLRENWSIMSSKSLSIRIISKAIEGHVLSI
jgi:hypothetical protein